MQALSWLPVAAGILAALIALDARVWDAGIEAPGTAEYRVLVLAVLLLAPLITFEAWRFRRWEPMVAVLAVVFGCVAALWPVFDWPTWTLAAAYAVAGTGGFVALTRWRRVAADSAALAVQALSWLPVVAGILAALIALDARLWDAGIEAPATAEYRTLVLVVLLLAPLITFEAWRFRRWEPMVAVLAVVFGCAAALWPVFDWPTWTLAGAYSLAGVGAFLALSRRRRTGRDSTALAVQALSWAGLLLGPLTALVAIGVRLEMLDANPATLVEFRTLAALLLPRRGGDRVRGATARYPLGLAAGVGACHGRARAGDRDARARERAGAYRARRALSRPRRAGRTHLRDALPPPELARAAAARRRGPARAPAGRAGLRAGRYALGPGAADRGLRLARDCDGARRALARRLRCDHAVRRGAAASSGSTARARPFPTGSCSPLPGSCCWPLASRSSCSASGGIGPGGRVRGWWGGEARLDAHSPLSVPVAVLFTALAPVLAILAVANPD